MIPKNVFFFRILLKAFSALWVWYYFTLPYILQNFLQAGIKTLEMISYGVISENVGTGNIPLTGPITGLVASVLKICCYIFK